MRLALALSSLVLAGMGCGPLPSGPAAPAVSNRPDTVDVEHRVEPTAPEPAERPRRRTLDDVLAAIADREPSFCGVYLEEGGAVLVLTDTSLVEQAWAAVEAEMADRTLGQPRRAVPAAYNFRQLYDWKRKLYDTELFQRVGVCSVDLDETGCQLHVGVKTPVDSTAAVALAREVGVPVDAFRATIDDCTWGF
jgi:hypothetical protein